MMIEVRPYQDGDAPEVVRLWRDCGLTMPHNDPMKDIERKAAVQPELFLVGCLEGSVVATVMAGYEGHRGWLNDLAVAPDKRRRGIGRRLVIEAEKRLRRLGCPKINLQVRRANEAAIAFYRRIGFARDDVVNLGRRLIDD